MAHLVDASHRPWALPPRPWIMHQTWSELLFAHWPVAPGRLRPHVPPGLLLDSFDGSAWIGVVPFRMSGVRLRWLPPFPGTRTFPELNVRTYVTRDGKPGVFFFSLDAASALAVAVARAWFRLPYHRAEMSCRSDDGGAGEVTYRSHRTHRGSPPADLAARYGPAGGVIRSTPGSLEEFLTERYCLYAAHRAGGLQRGELHHAPWPLQPAWAELATNTMTTGLGLELPAEQAVLHFARRLDVVVWAPERV